jgi:hypothetical protein
MKKSEEDQGDSITQEVFVCVINYYPVRDLEATSNILHEEE